MSDKNNNKTNPAITSPLSGSSATVNDLGNTTSTSAIIPKSPESTLGAMTANERLNHLDQKSKVADKPNTIPASLENTSSAPGKVPDESKAEVQLDEKVKPSLPQSSTSTKSDGASSKSVSENNVAPNSPSSSYGTKGIADILYEKGLLNPDQLKKVKFESANKRVSEEELIMVENLASENDVVQAKAVSFNIPFVDIMGEDIPVSTLMKVNYDVAKAHQAVAFSEEESTISVAMADPLDIQKVNYLQAILGKQIKTYFATPSAIKHIIDTKYTAKIESEVTEALEEFGEGVMDIEEGIRDITEVEGAIKTAPVARIINMVLEYAVKFKASDIHIEPREKIVAIRFRINGIMVERLQLPVKLGPSLVSRIKILANLKIDEHRVPQDGRFQIRVGKKEIDLRVSVMPMVYGEKVVIRLLEKGGGLMKLEDSGLRGSAFKVYKEAISATQGIILVTGPTGSGKTQTLASTLMILNRPQVNIITLEDPVEIRIEGITQIQVDSKVGLTFAKGLRSIVRQDPDIVMVGEIRDQETASLAVNASLVGRLVLATLHTNSAAGAMPRLLDMGIEPYLITSTLNVVVAQRLVRTICPDCKESYKASKEVAKEIHRVLQGLKGFDLYSFPKRDNPMQKVGQPSAQDPNKIPFTEVQKQQHVTNADPDFDVNLYRGKGCFKCNQTGYIGRTGIFEVLKVSEKIAQLIMEHRSSQSIEQASRDEGMITMVQDGFMKALEGITTIEEVLRVQTK